MAKRGKQKYRISVILGLAADGPKLKLLIIFKWKIGGLIEKSLLKNKYVLSEKCLVSVNQNAWSTESIIIIGFIKYRINV